MKNAKTKIARFSYQVHGGERLGVGSPRSKRKRSKDKLVQLKLRRPRTVLDKAVDVLELDWRDSHLRAIIRNESPPPHYEGALDEKGHFIWEGELSLFVNLTFKMTFSNDFLGCLRYTFVRATVVCRTVAGYCTRSASYCTAPNCLPRCDV